MMVAFTWQFSELAPIARFAVVVFPFLAENRVLAPTGHYCVGPSCCTVAISPCDNECRLELTFFFRGASFALDR